MRTCNPWIGTLIDSETGTVTEAGGLGSKERPILCGQNMRNLTRKITECKCQISAWVLASSAGPPETYPAGKQCVPEVWPSTEGQDLESAQI